MHPVIILPLAPEVMDLCRLLNRLRLAFIRPLGTCAVVHIGPGQYGLATRSSATRADDEYEMGGDLGPVPGNNRCEMIMKICHPVF